MYYISRFNTWQDYVYKNPVVSLLIGICVVSNIAAFICFSVEVILHPASFAWMPTILTLGMFYVPQLTAKYRHNSDNCQERKNWADIFFILYGAITHFICSFSVGYAGNSMWGCTIKHPFDCDMSHAGIWGAFFFAIASITGHAFGWEKIKKQRTQINYYTPMQKNPIIDTSTTPILECFEEYVDMVKKSFIISGITIFLSGILSVWHFAVEEWPLGLLYLIIVVVNVEKLVDLVYDTLIEKNTTGYSKPKWNLHYSIKEKSLLRSVINISLFVWVTGATWYRIGKRAHAQKEVGVLRVLSVTVATGLAFIQHFHI